MMPDADEYEFPVSPAQSRLLVLDRMNHGTAQYNVYVAFAVRGGFDAEAFRRALDAVVARHEALRTVFRTVGAEQVQVVRASARAEVRSVSGVPAADVDRLLVVEAGRPFDVEVGPLVRCLLLGVEDGSHRVLLTTHHVVCDGWSLQIVLRELSGFYRAAVTGTRYRLEDLPVQYPDYAVWQRDRMSAGGYAEQVAHWHALLHDAPKVLALPTDLPRVADRSVAGASEHFHLPVATLDRLDRVARSCGTTRFMTLFAAFSVFLGRLTHHDDIVVGVPTACRDRAELHGMVGMLANTLALRVDLSAEPSFREVLARVRRLVLNGQPHQDAPLEAVVEALAPDRELSHDPVFQVMFAYDDETELTLDLVGGQVERIPLLLDIAKFDLMLYVDRAGADLAARFEYRTGLLTPATVRRWVGTFQTLLDGLLDRPYEPVGEVEMLSEAECREILHDWNATAVSTPARPVPDLIAERAAKRPDAVAVVCGEVVLTYRDLLTRADRLAARLCAHGVGPDVAVGLCLPRGAGMAVAVLAVLRAGGAFVPLDSLHPAARIAVMVADSGARLVLAAAATSAQAAAAGVPVLLLDDDGNAEGSAARPAEPPPEAAPRPHHAAYVLFTSGSTGTPKGVLVEHGALTNLAVAVRPQFPVTEADRVLQFVSFGFDVAVSDFVFAFVAGAELHIATESERLGEELLVRLRDSRINYVFLPPAAVMSLPCAPGALPDLRTLAIGGEACPPELVRRWAPGRRVVNAYGPSEHTVYATTAVLRPDRPLVIGHPVANTRAYVLDARLQPVPVGVHGEIYLAGAGLARGYVNRPAMTAERFVACPFGPSGARMYRTGDLGRYDADGVLHYLGRVDNQVKLHGFRVELGEIEAVLLRHPDVTAAVAVVRQDGDGPRRLVAYVTGPDGRRPPDAPPLRAWLAQRLPRYMVPEVFVALDELPTNRSGKVDHARLPLPPAVRPELGQAFVAPRTAVERRIAAVWVRVLGVDRVGVHDNFFDLGGTSVRLLAVQAALRDSDPVSLVDLFRYPTVATLAGRLAGGEPGVDDDPERRGRERRRRLAARRSHGAVNR